MLPEIIKKETIYKDNGVSDELLETEDLLKKMFELAGTHAIEQIKAAISYKNTQDVVNANLKMIESNKKLAKSNEKYQFALNLLTGALVLVGLIQIGLQIRKK